MSLIGFDESNNEHLKAFHYFAYDAGHPEYLVNGVIADFDFDFRELLHKKFNLDECFIEEPNGSNHELLSRSGDKASFNIYYGTENDQDGYDELMFIINGTLFYNTETEKVVLSPDTSSIIMEPL